MVKVKRVVHLEDKNVGDEEIECIVGDVKKTTVSKMKGSADADATEERRSTRKIKKKRHKYEELDEDDDDFDFGLSSGTDDVSRSVTPVRGLKAAKKSSVKKENFVDRKIFCEDRHSSPPSIEGEFEFKIDSSDIPNKRPRLGRSRPSTPNPPNENFTRSRTKQETRVEAETDATNMDPPVVETPPVPKETIVFKANASNPSGFQTFLEFLLRVLRRKDSNGLFAHPPTETLCPGYFSVIEVPMDLDLIQQKWDHGLYVDLPTFRADLTLLFDNAIKYFDPATMVYHTARRLRHFVKKITGRDKLLEMKLRFPSLLAGIGIEELGLDEAELTENCSAARDDEGNLVVEVAEPTDHDEDMRIEWVRTELGDRAGGKNFGVIKKTAPEKPSARKPLSDNVSTQEVLTTWMSQVGGAGRKATPMTKKPNPMLSRQSENGLTTLSILNPDNAAVAVDANGEAVYRPDASEANAAVSLKQTLGRVAVGSGGVATYKEDRRNSVKPIKYIERTAFCSFGPTYDSRFSNLSKSDSDDLISAFHEESDFRFADEIKSAIRQASDYEIHAVDGLLDVITGGKHSEQQNVVDSIKAFEEAEETMRKMAEASGSRVDDDEIMEVEQASSSNSLSVLLDDNASNLLTLRNIQKARLSRAPPQHLALLKGPPEEEFELADKITSGLSSLTKMSAPQDLVSSKVILAALGVDLLKHVKNPMEVPTQPFAKEDVPQNVFSRTFGSFLS